MQRDQIILSTKVSRLLVPEDEFNLESSGPESIPRYKVEFDFTNDGIERP